MIKSIVYKSSTGHTKQYAEMLGESLRIPVYNLEEVKSSLKKNDEIIFLGWVCATKIQGLSKIKNYNVKCIGAVGAYPAEKKYIESLKKANKVNVELFYLRGGLDFNKLTGLKKKVLQCVGNMMEKEENAENQEMIKLFKDGANYVSDENLEPMVKYINSNCAPSKG